MFFIEMDFKELVWTMAGSLNAPVRVPIRLSRWLLAGLSLTHAGAILVLWPVALPLWIKWILLVMIGTGFGYSMRRHLFFSGDGPLELLLNCEDEWFITTGKGETCELQLLTGYYVHPWLVVLPFRGDAGKHTVILTPDMIDADVFRRLRVRLRYKKG